MNGPAFPQTDYVNEDKGPVSITDENRRGMSLRAYFAAHAPAEPQGWFEPEIAPMPTAPATEPSFPDEFPFNVDIGARNYIINIANGWRRDPCYDLSTFEPHSKDAHLDTLVAHVRPFLVDYETAWKAYWAAHNAWDDERAKQRLIQWPWAWADAVLAAGGGDL